MEETAQLVPPRITLRETICEVFPQTPFLAIAPSGSLCKNTFLLEKKADCDVSSRLFRL
ncbi:MAG: hypothetical protein HYW48_07115 [Deltaproteobacteria bacterium]|nr:hypothetical protein [Deltaproteobacteria bacterium]